MTNRTRHPRQGRPRSGEQGFVLLTLLFMAAAVAAGMALALPRIAMQAQRIREERLIYRGEQYKRAVQLYFRKHKKYPASLDDLEDTNGIRFLRRRYKDPISGEDEWRLVHMGNDGRFTDSLVFDNEELEQAKSEQYQAGAQPGATLGSPALPYQPAQYQPPDGRFHGADRARAVRQSAAPQVPGSEPTAGAVQAGMVQQIPGAPGTPPYDPNNPYAQATGNPGQPPVAGQQPVAGQYPGYSRMRPTQIPPAGRAPNPNQPNRGALGGAFNPGSRPATIGTGYNAPGGATVGNLPQTPAQPATRPVGLGAQGAGDAANIIKRLLTTPRPGGLAGLRAAQGQAGQPQSAFTGGIAGVATKAEERGVKVYGGFEYYSQWEFVYDFRQDSQFGASFGPQAQPGQGMRAGQPGLSSSPAISVTPSGLPGSAAPPQPGAGTAYPSGNPAAPGAPYGVPPTPARQPGLRAPYSSGPYSPAPGSGPPGAPGMPGMPGGPATPGATVPGAGQDPANPPGTPPEQQPGGAAPGGNRWFDQTPGAGAPGAEQPRPGQTDPQSQRAPPYPGQSGDPPPDEQQPPPPEDRRR